MIRVGRCKYNKTGRRKDPKFDGFTNIVVLMRSHSSYGVLGPYELKTADGIIFENYWQMQKVYEKIPASRQYYSRYDRTIIWDHPAETHYQNDVILPAYWEWRKKGFESKYPIRYPVGFNHRHKCLFAVKEGDPDSRLNYIEARKQIYVPKYMELVRHQDKFLELKNRLNNGENLLIIEVDGPHQESLGYYQEEYNVKDDFIVNDTILATELNISIMLNDEKHPFGHGYCLAMALLNMDWILEY